jgi:hypothetical protein
LQLAGSAPELAGASDERGDEAVYPLLVARPRRVSQRECRRTDGEHARVDAPVEGVNRACEGELRTAMLTLTDWEGEYGLPADIIKGGCPISGLFDLRPFPYTYLQPKLQLTWGEVLRNSPILRLPDEAPPLFVSYGGEETLELRRQSDDFLVAWRSRGLRGEHLPQPGKDHFSAIDGFLDVGSPLCAAILRQMDSTRP